LQSQADGSGFVDIGKNGGVGDIQIVINELIVDDTISVIDGMLVQFTFSGKSHTRSTELNDKLRSHF